MKLILSIMLVLSSCSCLFAQSASGSLNTNSVTYAGATFSIVGNWVWNGSQSGDGDNGYIIQNGMGSVAGWEIDSYAPGPNSSSANSSIAIDFYLQGNFSGPYSSAPTGLSYSSSKDESSLSYSVNHVTGGCASATATTANTTCPSSCGVGSNYPSASDFSNTPSGSVPGNPWMGANNTWSFSYYIYSNRMTASGNLSHPTSHNKDDAGEGNCNIWFELSWVD